jgi:3-phenylpropionate/trans-cinnamate dioxygenase ferredoxin subunit
MEWIKIFSGEEEARRRLTPGKPQLVIIGQTRICLALVNGNFRAVQDACSHNGESLSKGTINYLGEIICPWHNYRFEMSSGKACDSSCRDLRTYPVRTEAGGFYIGI